jgi:hypothetical protein
VDGPHVWVINAPFSDDGSVTELNAATGDPVRVLTGTRYQFTNPIAIAADRTHVWIANEVGDSVTEFPALSQ